METRTALCARIFNQLRCPTPLRCLNPKGQAVVEFTLIFVLLLVVAWIPADFGLALYTGQIAQNAAREGARIASADPNLVNGSCTMPCGTATAGTALKATADRMPAALLPGATIDVSLQSGASCNRTVTVTVSGNYSFFFYQVLRLMYIDTPSSTPIMRATTMRWEHNDGCIGT
jgi:Flp pilus assembly protein TadG